MSTEPKTQPAAQPKAPNYFRNWLSVAGAIISIGGFFAFVLLFAIDLLAGHGNPYMGILAYVVSPFFMFFGLFLALLGGWLTRRQWRKMGPGAPAPVLTIDFSRARDRKTLFTFAVGALVFLLVTALGSYQTYRYTESTQFCGQACHEPMKPHFVSYPNSPHARIACTDCHVGSGATAYMASKINGVRQLYCTLVGTYDRPIPSPIQNMRPAQETCEQCHWPQKYVGNLDRVYSRFLMDEENTHFAVRLVLKVGGGDPTHGPEEGIHWHMNLANKIEYIALDPQRQTIPWVRFTDAGGHVTEYRTDDFTDDPHTHEIRTMDCMDCHNRPAHRFHPPSEAVDLAMTLGKIDSAIPWIKSNAVAVLVEEYSTEPEALDKIAASLRALYPDHPKIDPVIGEVQRIYRQNFFPEMKADWRAYPDHSGHKNWAGCFRCHDGLHKAVTPGGRKMIPATDCNACHTILAQGTGPELEELSVRGHDFFHVDAVYSDFNCISCHTGGFLRD